MMDVEAIKRLVLENVRISAGDGEVRVATQCLYPSNGAVHVVVRGGVQTVHVSDEGGSVREASVAGLPLSDLDRHLARLVRKQGLTAENGKIVSPRVPVEAVGAAVVLVANASKEAADWFYDHFKIKPTRNFRKALAELLGRQFSPSALKHDFAIPGASNKLHKFEHVVVLPGDRMVLIDPVVREASSINARVVANLDVKNANNPLIEQRIVYDDEDEWTPADLNVLQIGAPLIPFSRAAGAVKQWAVAV